MTLVTESKEIEKEDLVPSQFTRFKEANWFDPKFTEHIVIGGAGGIGSWLSFYLARMGYKIFLYDFDTVDETNLGGQMYSLESVGIVKSNAVEDITRIFCQNPVYPLGKFTKEDGLWSEVMFSAFDNMEARRVMFDKWKQKTTENSIFIDGRMLAETGQVFFVTPDKIDVYEENIFTDAEIKDQPCTMKATSHCGAMIGALMASGWTNFVTNRKIGFDAREVPFKLEFELPLLMFQVKDKEQCRNSSKTTVKEEAA